MSNYWSMHCKPCDTYSESTFNHGRDILRGIANAYPHIKAALEADSSGYLEIEVMGHGHELISFLRDHEGHELALADEYGRSEPLLDENRPPATLECTLFDGRRYKGIVYLIEDKENV